MIEPGVVWKTHEWVGQAGYLFDFQPFRYFHHSLLQDEHFLVVHIAVEIIEASVETEIKIERFFHRS